MYVPATKLQCLFETQRRCADHGVSEATRQARNTQLKRYNKFCRKFHFKSFPCTAKIAATYATYLSDWIKPVSVRNYLSAIWYMQKMLGFCDYSCDFMLKQTLNGIERLCLFTPSEKYPLTAVDLLKMFNLLDMSDALDRAFWVAVVLCFRRLLRQGHITSSVHTLQACDVHIMTTYMTVRIRSSKTDQFGKDPFTIYLQRIPGSPLCPAALLSEMLKATSPAPILLQANDSVCSSTFINSIHLH